MIGPEGARIIAIAIGVLMLGVLMTRYLPVSERDLNSLPLIWAVRNPIIGMLTIGVVLVIVIVNIARWLT